MVAGSIPHEHEDNNYRNSGDLEEICSSHGFEYVEGTIHTVSGLSSCSANLCQALTPLTIGVGEGISRIVMGLQTIMWPYMQQQHPRSPKRKAPPKPNILSIPSLENSDSIGNIEWTRFPADEFHAEKIALEKWLDPDDTWPTVVAPINPLIPTMLPDSRSSNNQPHNTAGFDDDFFNFVSAPAPAPVPETIGATCKGVKIRCAG